MSTKLFLKMYDNPEDYFIECIKFFQDYQYLYNSPNTNVLVDDVFDKISIHNLDNIDVYNEEFELNVTKDENLKDFFERLDKIKPIYDDFCVDESLKNFTNAPLSMKKLHEIIYLSREIRNVCEETNCEVVVDFGSGLGYLDQQIFETTDLKVLGLECNESHYVSAKKRQRKYHEKSIENIKYVKHTITGESHLKINEYLSEKFANCKDFCITGLHACADLTIDAINIFLKMESAKSLILMPCCYHKLIEEGEFFKNIPLSKCLKDIVNLKNGWKCINIPFLRLAAQPPSYSDKLEDLVFNLLARSVLQLYAYRRNCKLRRKKRKAVKTKIMENNFETYIGDACTNGFTLLANESSHNQGLHFDLEEIMSIWRQLSELTSKKAGIFILLQKHLQPVFENFILYDRIVYLRENGVVNCRIKKVFNEKISPRSIALLAYK